LQTIGRQRGSRLQLDRRMRALPRTRKPRTKRAAMSS
jgi:hypothetical protein